jgi:hypothetical protein
MLVQNLEFFDKFGQNLNLNFNVASGVWEGKIYFEPISNYLFDNENLFVLEKVGTTYKFPQLANNQQYFEFAWVSNKTSNEFFLYEVVRDIQLDEKFITKIDKSVIKYSDIDPVNTNSLLDVSIPLQVNIAFCPTDEVSFERTLQMFWFNGTSRVKIAELYFYGEGVEEDTRFRNWAENFGIRFLREDANILKNYDIKEAFPDMEALNQIRKELLVSKDQVYPYVGTYKGLVNFINLLGYKDVLRIKEYWLNYNQRSAYYNKMTLIDISDYLDDGIIQSLDLEDKNRNLKFGKQFKKTEFLALVYQFTVATDNFDDDNIPIVEETTEFTVNEIFYKLNLLNDKIKNEFLPINVKVKDIIGEFIYFQKITLTYWTDPNRIFDYMVNDYAEIDVYPGKDADLTLRALDPLYRRVSEVGLDLGVARINNNGSKNPFEYSQVISTRTEAENYIENIETFYTEIKNQRIPNLGKKLTWEFGDDPQRVIGAPTVFTLDTGKFTLQDLRGVRLDDLDAIAPGLDPHWTFQNIDFRNFYEVNWRITKPGPNPYNFELRGRIVDLFALPHVLPFAGTYRVIVELFDFSGNVSVFSRFVTVQDDKKPEILAITRLEDKFDYFLDNLKNVRLQDFGASHLYYPKVNVLDNEDAAVKLDPYKNLLEWISFYKHRYGMGQSLYDAEIYDSNLGTWVPYTDTTQSHPKKGYWGLGEGDLPIQLKDFSDVEVGELYWMRITDLIYLDDFNAGFYLINPAPGNSIFMSLFSEYVIPNFSTLEELAVILNDSDHPGINLFNYEVIEGKIHAQAEYLSKEMYHILGHGGFSPGSPGSPGFSPGSPGFSPSPFFDEYVENGYVENGYVGNYFINSSVNNTPLTQINGTESSDKYTFFLPRKVFSQKLIDFLTNISPVFDIETLFLLAKTSDVLTGAVQDPTFWRDIKCWKFVDDVQIGHLPTTIDQNALNINDIKLFEESFAVPENAIVFFVVNSLDGKNEFYWTLTDSRTGDVVMQVRSVPFFAWKFKDLGTFSLSCRVIDNRGTEYTNEVKNFVQVLDKRQYITGVERRLNDRKIKIIKSGSLS